jgi:hypothetical protein
VRFTTTIIITTQLKGGFLMRTNYTKNVKVGLAAVAFLAIGTSVYNFTSADPGAKTTICHYPPGNTGNMQTITVGQNAVSSHLAHGDAIGQCPCTQGSTTFVKQ